MTTLYDEVGGSPVFRRLVDGFYDQVASDPVLRPLYPDEDLGPARDRLRMFLEQYWGGPTAYSDERGHPRLRRRHAAWTIGERERDAWLGHMLDSLDALGLDAEHDRLVREHLRHAAFSLVNHQPLP